ncbi:MAG: hypothetical protein JWM56_494 [Candidatus Peribacteria bacterium]|nr:hypothetical protein [Candidatus Peribacteria bacterium]
MKNILVTGSMAYDLLLSYDGSFADAVAQGKPDALSLAFVTSHFERHYGGTAANIAWNLKLLAQDPLIVSTVGSDGEAYLQFLQKHGMKTDLIDVVSHDMTATAIMTTDTREQQITLYHPGADGAGSWPDLSAVRDVCSYAIVSPRNSQLMLKAALWCHETGLPFLFDPGQWTIGFGTDELRRVVSISDGLIVNDYEWSLLSDRLSVSVVQALELTPMLIITKGEEGLVIHTREDAIYIPACKADRFVNPTGAGDALRAGFLTGLSLGWNLKESGQLGAAIASLVVEQEGTQLASLDMDVLQERAVKAYGERFSW